MKQLTTQRVCTCGRDEPKDDGVVFTSDNVLCKLHTWLQEGDPLRADTLVPGHGPMCDKSYLREQGAFVEEWIDQHGADGDEAQRRPPLGSGSV
jgi:hypothetical protein